MIKFAVIGTNWITQKFVQAAHETQSMKLAAVYSRNIESASQFAQEFNVNTTYDSLDALASDSTIEAVYIASPNSLHCTQSILMMKHGKHVICEKPVASNIDEATQMFEVAEQNGVVLFEAYKSQFLPNFKQVQLGLEKIGKVHKAHINYCQYSSRYQKYLNGDNPNTFNPAFSNGSLVDIGFYCVAATVALFGKPESAHASAKLLDSGVDAHGCAVFQYPEFDVTLAHSKVSDSYAPSEIQGECGAIIIDHIAECTDVKIRYRDGRIENLTQTQSENSMSYEAQAFANCIGGDKTTQAEAEKRALTVAKLITEMRQQVGVVYPADK
ncbi:MULTISPECIES: Gfo/Idh/MocA family protein [Vibrio]|jgi:predicted dehydrogenase|uniref:Gfo/Idh/MocA family oxidoreductase n=2 Tax=Vibrio cyclitrophicus TaxID=47951 RepID=A0AAN0LS00_9VIBR|nr:MULTISPECIES: Gfo/Idh/MocA family oxidoreductase [Vibrio]KNH11368.1 oxidoreductase [Vibrio lentus]MBY7660762.1 Gfo/Idh/MocA family oxidoreductase [Vibrio atlanticus]KAA8599244.1 putative oxidoreductase YgjR [Vibrio cyclitrophicus]MBE8556432.1 Gfo/Idh/MocA family oxidoreductase [Vibrio sp. OPT24]MCC4773850.1 Gfo/Idh/MocA family oxidoreductase [Vibrio cyclitrophicus]